MSEYAILSIFTALLACAAFGVALFCASDCAQIRKELIELERNHFKLVSHIATKTAFEPLFKREEKNGDHKQG